MQYRVLKPVATTLHRLHPGDEVTVEDFDSPEQLARFIELGYLGQVTPPPPPDQPAAAA